LFRAAPEAASIGSGRASDEQDLERGSSRGDTAGTRGETPSCGTPKRLRRYEVAKTCGGPSVSRESGCVHRRNTLGRQRTGQREGRFDKAREGSRGDSETDSPGRRDKKPREVEPKEAFDTRSWLNPSLVVRASGDV
jgi:hypothetical protein